jgi:hypothetical protein
MNNILRQILAVASFIGFLVTAPIIITYPSGSLGAILFALATLGFCANTIFLLFVQSEE